MKKLFIKEKKINISDLLFGLAYLPWIYAWMFTSTYYKDILHPYAIIKFMQVFGIILLLLRLGLKSKIKVRSLIISILMIICGTVVSYNNQNASLVFYSVIIIVLASDMNLEKIVRWTMVGQICITLITIFSAFAGIIPNVISNSMAGGFSRIRYGMGYTYSTFLPNYLLSILIEYIYLKKNKKWKILEIAIFLICNMFTYYYTRTRLAFGMISVVLFAEFINIFRKHKVDKSVGGIFSIFTKWGVVLCAAFSILTTCFYDSSRKFLAFLNTLLSERLRFGKMGLIQHGVSLFGSDVVWETDASKYNYIDSSYINIMICYGLIVFLVVIVGFTIAGRFAAKENNRAMCLALLLWFARAVIDPQLFLLWFNPFLFLIGEAFSGILKKRRSENAVTSMRIQ